MQRIFSILFCLVLSGGVFAQSSDKEGTKDNQVSAKIASPNAPMVMQPAIVKEAFTFKEDGFDFGKIPQGKPVTHVFEFVNTGNEPLALQNVQAACGCTTPVWNKDLVAPGQSAKITVGYNSAAEGAFAKPVTITYGDNVLKQIIIKGEVYKTPVTPAPLNEAINNLKNQ